MKALLALALLAATPGAGALAVLDAGPQVVGGPAGAWAERRLLLDLWDAPQPARSFHVAVAPDSDSVEAEARVRALRAPEGPWLPLGEVHLAAGPDPLASDRGWDGAHELALRFRLVQPRAKLALLLVEDPPGEDALAITTALRALPPAPAGAMGDSRAALPGAGLPDAVPGHAGWASALPPISLAAAVALLAALWARRRSPQR